ncbi:MAG: hypothetical protein U0354_11855 [Candidatus Sericytochromatia bacterium]
MDLNEKQYCCSIEWENRDIFDIDKYHKGFLPLHFSVISNLKFKRIGEEYNKNIIKLLSENTIIKEEMDQRLLEILLEADNFDSKEYILEKNVNIKIKGKNMQRYEYKDLGRIFINDTGEIYRKNT